MLERAAPSFLPQGACTIGRALDASNGIGPGFNTIRLAGAVVVLMTHVFDLTRRGVSAEPVSAPVGGPTTMTDPSLYGGAEGGEKGASAARQSRGRE